MGAADEERERLLRAVQTLDEGNRQWHEREVFRAPACHAAAAVAELDEPCEP